MKERMKAKTEKGKAIEERKKGRKEWKGLKHAYDSRKMNEITIKEEKTNIGMKENERKWMKNEGKERKIMKEKEKRRKENVMRKEGKGRNVRKLGREKKEGRKSEKEKIKGKKKN